MPKNQLSQSLVFAVDLGGTHLRVALVDDKGNILQHLKQETPKGDSPDGILDALASAAREWHCRQSGTHLHVTPVPGFR